MLQFLPQPLRNALQLLLLLEQLFVLLQRPVESVAHLAVLLAPRLVPRPLYRLQALAAERGMGRDCFTLGIRHVEIGRRGLGELFDWRGGSKMMESAKWKAMRIGEPKYVDEEGIVEEEESRGDA